MRGTCRRVMERRLDEPAGVPDRAADRSAGGHRPARVVLGVHRPGARRAARAEVRRRAAARRATRRADGRSAGAVLRHRRRPARAGARPRRAATAAWLRPGRAARARLRAQAAACRSRSRCSVPKDDGPASARPPSAGEQRRSRLRGPDAMRRHVRGRWVVVVDDVVTTGATSPAAPVSCTRPAPTPCRACPGSRALSRPSARSALGGRISCRLWSALELSSLLTGRVGQSRRGRSR